MSPSNSPLAGETSHPIEQPVDAVDDYQFVDVTRGGFDSIDALQKNYCVNTNPRRRAIVLALIRTQVPGYPASGLCTAVDQVLADEITKRAAQMPEVDFEQAVEDQKRFEETAP